MRAAVDLAARGDDRVGESGEVLEDVKLTLIGPAERGPRVEVGDRGAVDLGDVGGAGAVCGVELLVEDLLLVVRAKEQVAVEAAEVAVDVLEPNDLLDAINGGHVALDDESGVGLAVDGLEVVDAVVHRPSEVGGGAPGLAAADRSVVDEHNLPIFTRGKIGCSDTSDAGADHADICCDILCNRSRRKFLRCPLP